MSGEKFEQYSECDSLKKVILGRWEGYAESDEYIEIVNEEQKKGLPGTEQLKSEFGSFKTTLERHGVEVLTPKYVGPFVYDQLTPRDIGVTIGNQFIVCNMVKKSRRYEVAGIFEFLNEMEGDTPAVIIPESNALLEGGDILLQDNMIFVGLSQRTNKAGFAFLERQFGDRFNLMPVHCTSLSEGENVLHLDCTLNILGQNHALIYKDGFKSIPEAIKKMEWIEITAREQQLLGTNVLSIDAKTLISRDHPELKNLNHRLRERGFEVIEVKFDGAPATGGSFRCCTLPLVRAR